ncbi:putative TetR family transcriptional regulator [Nocardia brasiliensis NBRC 14402]|uniref:TetR/AcrR family transcriptional regulator n=1 Tax=Nocardia brasiliensis TaxID=37326 RepID=UPI000301FB36|nr:TetR/AcrR family transcriptional regulator [Nocardia brasiliensis]ASF11092.1 TetR/AcrR family transcriptional regulator [Nocardia brasiliensis]GAJ83202.1 putative TetR family transcriptional regulator [Nocardia brasiliensis NBRC 14402]SUB10229.1 HTH-type transcriptional repressor AcnR [Nocardia brasiliensis]
MGNREDLLAGARRCLLDKGYARTTVRDIATAAGGVSMAAIGYHFGSKEALLNEALAEANREWGVELERALTEARRPDSAPLDRFASSWSAVIDSIGTHRGLWAATFDTIAQAGHDPATKDQLAARMAEARGGLAYLLADAGTEADSDAADPRKAQALGAFYQILLTGLAAQCLIDPEHAPSGADLAAAIREITE